MGAESGRLARADAILEMALELDPEARAAYVADACEADPELQALVERLLVHALGDDERLGPAGAVQGALGRDMVRSRDPARRPASTAPPLGPGAVLGSYRLVKELGRGGMAEVFLAERIDGQLEQWVAVKLIRRGVDSEDVLRRFRREGRIMALAQHPHIARVLTAGTTPDGRPYFVMEYVDGWPIDQYCDAAGLGVDERIRLFVRVARAVAYAHRHLVIHRDIKPSNVLVSVEGEPKLLDFGIAKLLDSDDAGEIATRTGERLMTPAYGSPEQLEGRAVTTASDVYQLGLLLYRLLTGVLPFSTAGRARTGAQLPTRPSLAVGTGSATTAPPVGTEDSERRRRATLRRLRRRLRGDLDNILLMALRPEPERRYPSVEQLLEDLERHADHRPVAARPDTVGYRITALARRNPIAVALGTALVLSLGGAAIGLVLSAQRLAEERDRAHREVKTATAVSDLLVDVFELSDPNRRRGDRTAEEVLQAGRVEVVRQLEAQPRLRARFEQVIGRIFLNLGAFGLAEQALDEAARLYRAELGPEATEVARARGGRGRARLWAARYPEAREDLEAALAILRADLGDRHPYTLEARNGLAILEIEEGNLPAAEDRLLGLFDDYRTVEGDLHPETLRVQNNLGVVYVHQERLEEAEAVLREVIEGRERTLGADHPLTLASRNILAAVLLRHEERLKEGAAILEGVLEVQRELLGPDHIDTLDTASNLAAIYHIEGEHCRAEPLMREVLKRRSQSLGPDHPDVIGAMNNLALVLAAMGEGGEAVRVAEAAVGRARRNLGAEHPSRLDAEESLAELYAQMGRHRAAAAQWARVHRAAEASLGADNARTLGLLLAWAAATLASGDAAEARALLERARAAGATADMIEDETIAAAWERLPD